MKNNDMINVTEHKENIGTAWNWDLMNWSPVQYYWLNRVYRKK